MTKTASIHHLNTILQEKKASIEDIFTIYENLEPATLAFMKGRWKGFEIETGNKLEGLLTLTGWYGKLFISPEEVHPLLFYTKRKTALYAVNPNLIPLSMEFPKFKVLSTIMALAKPFLQTKKSMARMRMIEYRGKITGTMVYDKKAIMDHFAKIDDNTMLGMMDLKGDSSPYVFVLERDDTDYTIRL